jgi:hypothetical protein
MRRTCKARFLAFEAGCTIHFICHSTLGRRGDDDGSGIATSAPSVDGASETRGLPLAHNELRKPSQSNLRFGRSPTGAINRSDALQPFFGRKGLCQHQLASEGRVQNARAIHNFMVQAD